MTSKGIIMTISGPSGVGKGTVIDRLFEIDDKMRLSISKTTRQPRISEKDKVDYYFVEKEEFLKEIDQGLFLEHNKYGDNYYGTPIKPILEWLDNDFDVLCEVEINGATLVKQKSKEILKTNMITIFLLPPSVEKLKQRLIGRNTNTACDINGRLTEAKNELKKAYNCDYLVINDDIDTCARQIFDIINLEKRGEKAKEFLLSQNIKLLDILNHDINNIDLLSEV